VEDENADRVYVPGTNGTPPDRDVEPFWPPEELNAPVHGGKPVPRDAPQAFPLPPAPPVTAPQQGDPSVYRPVDRVVTPPPAPPMYHQQSPQAAQPQVPQQPIPRPAPGPDGGAAQPWPNIPPRTGASAAPDSGHFSASAHVPPPPATSVRLRARAGRHRSPDRRSARRSAKGRRPTDPRPPPTDRPSARRSAEGRGPRWLMGRIRARRSVVDRVLTDRRGRIHPGPSRRSGRLRPTEVRCPGPEAGRTHPGRCSGTVLCPAPDRRTSRR
jgi:hypothetical protein